MENTDLNRIEEPSVILTPASIGKRLANYIIDITLYYFLIFFLLIAFVPEFHLEIRMKTTQPFSLPEQLLVTFVYGIFLSIIEAVFKGKSVSKYITGTKVVTEDGSRITSQIAFTRGLIRIIPFEQLSALSLNFYAPYPWHDRWSGSIVVDEAKSVLPKN